MLNNDDTAVHALLLNLKDYEYRKLKARAQRAELPLETYIINAASDPLRYAWFEDVEEPIAEVKP